MRANANLIAVISVVITLCALWAGLVFFNISPPVRDWMAQKEDNIVVIGGGPTKMYASPDAVRRCGLIVSLFLLSGYGDTNIICRFGTVVAI